MKIFFDHSIHLGNYVSIPSDIAFCAHINELLPSCVTFFDIFVCCLTTVCVTSTYSNLQILEAIGEKLEMLDLSGSVMSSITDEGLTAVTKYCPNLQNLGEFLQLT